MMSTEFALDLQKQPLYTVQDAVSPTDLWNKIQHIREGGEFRPAIVHYAKDVGNYCLVSAAQDPVAIEGRVDGGNHRALACAIEGTPFKVRTPTFRKNIRRLPIRSLPITDLILTDDTSELSRNRVLYPQYYTNTPTEDDLAYMSERIDAIRANVYTPTE